MPSWHDTHLKHMGNFALYQSHIGVLFVWWPHLYVGGQSEH